MPKQQFSHFFKEQYIQICLLLVTFFSISSDANAQWTILNINTKVNMRAVHTVTPTICWIGGTQGTVFRTTNGGKSWTTIKIPSADSLDFRDIHAFDKNTAVAMSAGLAQDKKARIYRTTDGGETWEIVYQTTQNGVFLDGIDFWSKDKGICLGDPIDGRLFILTTDDNGKSWQELPLDKRPVALPGEASFAASGTSILAFGKGDVFIGTGGSEKARVFRSEDYGRSWKVSETPLPAGPSSGIFGLRFWSRKNGIAVGGDYKNTTDSTRNVLETEDGGVTWTLNKNMTKPTGLKECVDIYHKTNATWNGNTQIRADNYVLVAVGPSGSSSSADYGKTWRVVGTEGFHSISFAGNVGYAVGANGIIGKIDKVSIKKSQKKLKLVDF